MSLNGLRGELRGPEGARARMAELKARLAPPPAAFAATLKGAETKGAGTKAGETKAGLSGTIASGGTQAPPRPMDPFAATVAPSASEAELRAQADAAARAAGVDPKLFASLVTAESGWDPLSRSSAGAQGLAQLMPDTARGLGVTNPLDPRQNLAAGARYLRQMLDRFHGDARLAVAAYNAGPGAVERAGGVPNYPETRAYVKRVLGGLDGGRVGG